MEYSEYKNTLILLNQKIGQLSNEGNLKNKDLIKTLRIRLLKTLKALKSDLLTGEVLDVRYKTKKGIFQIHLKNINPVELDEFFKEFLKDQYICIEEVKKIILGKVKKVG